MRQDRLVFGSFSFDRRTLELWQHGRRVPIEPQPARLLALLTERPGDLVTPEEIRRHLWGDAAFVDFDRGIRYAVGHLRGALGEKAVDPVFIHTLPKRGYRFVAGVRAESAPQVPVAVLSRPARGSVRALAAGVLVGVLPGALFAHVVEPAWTGNWFDWGCLRPIVEVFRAWS